MQFDWWTLALQTVNFAVLVWLLHRFLYKPVLRLVDARREEIDRSYADAEAAGREAETRLKEAQAARQGIAEERNDTLKAAAARAEEAAATRRAQAQREAEALVQETRKSLASERQEAETAARTLALDLGIDVARRLLGELPAELRAEAWVERIETHLAGLDAAQHAALTEAMDGGRLTVVTATALPQETADTWRVRLQTALDRETQIAFEVDPEIIAGAELHFPTAILRLSWRSALDNLRSEIEQHDPAD